MTPQVLNNRIEQLMQCFREQLNTQICHPWYPPPVHLPCEPQHSQDNSNDWCQWIFNFETMPTLVAHLTIIRLHSTPYRDVSKLQKLKRIDSTWKSHSWSELQWAMGIVTHITLLGQSKTRSGLEILLFTLSYHYETTKISVRR